MNDNLILSKEATVKIVQEQVEKTFQPVKEVMKEMYSALMQAIEIEKWMTDHHGYDSPWLKIAEDAVEKFEKLGK